MCYSAEKLISETGDKVSEAEKNEVNAKVAALRDSITNGSIDTIKANMDELQKALYSVSEKLYQQNGPQGDPNAQGPVDPGQGGNSGGDGNVYDADFKDVN